MLPAALAQTTDTGERPPLSEEAVSGIRDLLSRADPAMRQEEIAALSLFLGILAFAVMVAILLVRTRRKMLADRRTASERIAELNARVDRAEGLLAAEQQALVVWPADGGPPDIHCQPGVSKGLPARGGDVLAFGKWLEPDSASELETAVSALRSRGETFNVMARARAGGYVEADGRTAGGRAVLRLRDLAGQRRELAEIHDRYKRLMRDSESFKALLDAVPMPAWLADASGALTWVNEAYARIVGASDPQAALGTQAMFLSDADRSRLDAARSTEGIARLQVPVQVAGAGRLFDVAEVSGSRHGAGLAFDATELDRLRRELSRRDDTHARTLDQISAAVAVFGPDQRLAFYNRAFRKLWMLDEGFLAGAPGQGEILDRLRAMGRLPEQADYRDWRRRQLAVFDAQAGQKDGQAGAQDEALWHLPDARVLRVVRSRQSDGGVACLYEDISAALDLESRLVAVTSVQRETLEALDEGIVVFGSDGRMRLHNPAFARIWRLAEEGLGGNPHVEEVIGWCRALHPEDTVWTRLRGAATALSESREISTARLERRDGSVIVMRVLPLPDGGTLVVFTDISDSARMERALRDRNEALLTAARIKNEFVHKVSYELRAPLTNVIGFAQLMSDAPDGDLSERQREYTGYILSSSSALLAIINDILDLATIDAGVMELDISEVDIRQSVDSVVEGLRDRLAESKIGLDLRAPPEIGSFEADEKRLRQILFNLLSNAIGFSEPGQTVRLEASRPDPATVMFTVSDEGPGIPESVREAVFERFESHSSGTRYRGAGLGLSIVKSFVELHGGWVTLESEAGRGTTVICRLPTRQPIPARAGTEGMETADARVYTLPLRTPPANETMSGAPASGGRASPAPGSSPDMHERG